MSKLGPLAKQLTTAADAPLVQLLERLVTAEVKGPYARLLVARLTGAALKVVESSVKAAERLLMLTGEIFVAGKVVAQRRTSFAHLFGDGLKQARADPARASYLRLADQMNELLGTTAGRDALKSDAVRKSAEALRNQLTENVGFGVFDRYEDLRHETSALNHLNRVLTPDDYPGGIRFDAHHLVEDRTYQKFAAEWKLIGWQKPEDMMATAIPWESHIRSSASKKGLAGFEERPEALLSLTKRLQDAIPLDKYSNAGDLIDAYVQFYRQRLNYKGNEIVGAETTNRIVEALKALKAELGRAHDQAALVAKAAALKAAP